MSAGIAPGDPLPSRLRCIPPALRGPLLGGLLFLPLLPALCAHLGGNHLETTLAADKLLLLGYVAVLLWSFPAGAPSGWLQLGLVSAVLALSCVSAASGFASASVHLGLAALLLWRHWGSAQRDRRATASAFFILAALWSFGFHTGLIGSFRSISIALVDGVLDALGVEWHRVGITYFLGTQQLAVWERCSGLATTRALLVLLAAHSLWRGRHLRLWLVVPFQALGLGILCNTLRIVAHLLWSHHRGADPGALVHEALGLGIFLAVLLATLALERRGQAWPCLAPVPRGRTMRVRGARVPAAAAVATVLWIGLAGSILSLPVQGPKRMEHRYESWVSYRLERIHSNWFLEPAGGGGWILLEHPIEVCLAYHGWDLDREHMRYNRSGQTLRLEARYRIGGREFAGRWQALWAKWSTPALWRLPVEAQIDVLEPLSIGRGLPPWEPAQAARTTAQI